MQKIITHLKNNAPIYIIILTCIVIISIALFIKKEDKVEKIDTSMFQVVTFKEALKLFDDKEPKILVMSVDGCTATINYVDSLKIAQAKYGYTTYYLDLNNAEKELEDFNKFIEKLDFEYNFRGKIDKFSSFIENTPSTIIIKNKEMVYGYIGSMNEKTLHTITELYGVTNNETN